MVIPLASCILKDHVHLAPREIKAPALPPAIDLRSDTVTKPSPEMRRAMFEAEVGDDVYAEDPTINRLEKRAAEIFGREAALFVPSGTMGNQIAIKLHTHHGQEVICEERGHVFNYEMAMMAHFSGVVPRTVWAEDGILTWEHVKSKLKTKSYHAAQDRPGFAGEHAQHGRWNRHAAGGLRRGLRQHPRLRACRCILTARACSTLRSRSEFRWHN